MEVGIILGQDAYGQQKAIDYKIGTRSESVAVLTEFGWVITGHMKVKRGQKICHFASTEIAKMAENVYSW